MISIAYVEFFFFFFCKPLSISCLILFEKLNKVLDLEECKGEVRKSNENGIQVSDIRNTLRQISVCIISL